MQGAYKFQVLSFWKCEKSALWIFISLFARKAFIYAGFGVLQSYCNWSLPKVAFSCNTHRVNLQLYAHKRPIYEGFRGMRCKKGRLKTVLKVVEVTGLEPAASCSQSRHSSQTELHLDMIIKFLRSCSVVLWSPSCKIVALYTAVSIALFCCASSSSLYLPPAAVALVTQSRHSSQTELHLEVY